MDEIKNLLEIAQAHQKILNDNLNILKDLKERIERLEEKNGNK